MKELVILIPVFNDWDSVDLLLPRIEEAMAAHPVATRVLLIDDGSTLPAPAGFDTTLPVEILHLRRNLGHQRAIAIGLYQVAEHTAADAVLVMDGDGEDRAEHLPLLLAEFERAAGREVVFAARTRRHESAIFQISYHAYRALHWLLTGLSVRVGNFSVVPRSALTRLMVVSDLWNHYAAAVFRARLPHRTLPLERGVRLRGNPHMNYTSLIVHGLSAISVFSDTVGARLLLLSGAFAALVAGLLAVVQWTPLGAAMLVMLTLQAITFAALFAFTIISGRSQMSFLPIRDAAFFIEGHSRPAGKPRSLDSLGRALEVRQDAQVRLPV